MLLKVIGLTPVRGGGGEVDSRFHLCANMLYAGYYIFFFFKKNDFHKLAILSRQRQSQVVATYEPVHQRFKDFWKWSETTLSQTLPAES